jgi:hypothetical protein
MASAWRAQHFGLLVRMSLVSSRMIPNELVRNPEIDGAVV